MSTVLTLPWNAWSDKEELNLKLPESWEIDIFKLPPHPIVDEDIIEKITEDIYKDVIKKHARSIAFAVDDLTRPLSYQTLFSHFYKLLKSNESFRPEVTIIIALGTHGALTQREIEKKVGTQIFKYEKLFIVNHDPVRDVIPTDIQWQKSQVRINKYFLRSQYKVIISTVVPHPFAGFSGGAKMILPGLADLEITKRTHQMALMGFVGRPGTLEGNRFRKLLDQFVEQISVDFFIGFLTNSNREPIFLAAGDLKNTYQKIINKAKEIYGIPHPQKTYDVIFLNAYPKDSELLQIDTALNPLLSAKSSFWKKGSIAVVLAACSKGLGRHGLFEPGGRLYRPPQPKRRFEDLDFCFFLPQSVKNEFPKVFWSGYNFFSNFEFLITHIENRFSSSPKVAIFPTASIQFVAD